MFSDAALPPEQIQDAKRKRQERDSMHIFARNRLKYKYVYGAKFLI